MRLRLVREDACRMSKRNVELTRRGIDAFNAGDIEALIALCDPSIEFQSAFAAVGGSVYHGHDGMRQWQRDFADAWGGEIRVEPEAYFDLSEHTLVFNLMRGRGRHSGAEVAMPMAAVFGWRDGLLFFMRGYAHREDALSDLGVSEDALEPIAP
jgi:ketosteroid isomerase-like protein